MVGGMVVVVMVGEGILGWVGGEEEFEVVEVGVEEVVGVRVVGYVDEVKRYGVVDLVDDGDGGDVVDDGVEERVWVVVDLGEIGNVGDGRVLMGVKVDGGGYEGVGGGVGYDGDDVVGEVVGEGMGV